MSGATRAARPDELARVWPAVRSARLMASEEAFRRFAAEGPWRVRVSDAGDVLLADAWREDGDTLAIQGLWAPDARVGSLVDDAAAVARSRGFGRVLSPLLAEDRARPYRAAGMDDLARLVAYAAPADGIAASGSASLAPSYAVRPATEEDVAQLVALDALVFEPFWRNGAAEFARVLRDGRVVVAADPAGVLAGYASCTLIGSTAALGHLAVHPAHRRGGIAAALLRESARWAGAEGAMGMSLCTQEENTPARALYRATGFAEVRERYVLLSGPA